MGLHVWWGQHGNNDNGERCKNAALIVGHVRHFRSPETYRTWKTPLIQASKTEGFETSHSGRTSLSGTANHSLRWKRMITAGLIVGDCGDFEVVEPTERGKEPGSR